MSPGAERIPRVLHLCFGMAPDFGGKPWSLAGSVAAYDGSALTFSGPDDLVRKLASHPQLHGCFAQGALEWALGRPLVTEDRELVSAAAAAAARSRGDVVAILSAIVAAPAFTTVVVAR